MTDKPQAGAQDAPAVKQAPTQAELWSLIRAFADSCVDCDRSRGTVSAQYRRLAESNLQDAVRSLYAATGASHDK